MKMKLGTKIAIGFGALIVIACVLGGLSIWSMKGVEKDSVMLADEYVPEVDIAVDLRGAANRLMFEMRGYGFTEDDQYYKNAQKEMQAVQAAIDRGMQLGKTAKNLKALGGQLDTAQKSLGEYKSLIAQTLENNAKMQAARSALDEAAVKYMNNANDFRSMQNVAFKKELNERQKKVQTVTQIVALGTKVRVTNFKAQATDNMAMMQDAIDTLSGLGKYTGELRPITRDAEDIKRIDATEAAANRYSENMAKYIKATNAMDEAESKMAAAATSYMENCRAFLDSQNEAMRKEFYREGANLEERLQKITWANEIIGSGNAIRLANVRAMMNHDPKMIRETMEKFRGVKDDLASLRSITRQNNNLRQLKEIEASADLYLASMGDYLNNILSLETFRKEMDSAAAQYVAQCQDYLDDQQRKLARDMLGRNTKIALVNDIVGLGNDARINAYKSQALRSPAIMEMAQKNFPRLDEKYAELREITKSEINLKQIENIRAAGNQYSTGMSDFLASWIFNNELGVKRTNAGNTVVDACETLAKAGMDNTNEIAQNAASSLGMSSTIMIIGLIVALFVGIVVAFVITRSITKPINRIIEALSAGSDQVSSASGQVSGSSQQLAEGASENAAALEETSSSLEEMSSMTKANADNAAQANSLMEETRSTVARAGDSMKKMTQSMDDISTSGQEIGKIIKTIDEIAFQTNLLALNAAVEAARAGEAGQGFAVVADEVRNLAQRAAEAAKNTAELIEGTIVKIDEGNRLVKTTDEAFNEVESTAGKVGELVSEIAAASSEQSQGIEQINNAMTQMDKVTQQNAANAEESASASEELSAQAESMKGVVNDLIELVGGATDGSHSQSRQAASVAPVRRLSHGNSGTGNHAAPPKPTARAGKSSAVVKADQVIPMDDDFADF